MIMTCPSGNSTSQMKTNGTADTGVFPWRVAGLHCLSCPGRSVIWLHCMAQGNLWSPCSICAGLLLADGVLSPAAGLSQAEESACSFSPERLLGGVSPQASTHMVTHMSA